MVLFYGVHFSAGFFIQATRPHGPPGPKKLARALGRGAAGGRGRAVPVWDRPAGGKKKQKLEFWKLSR